MASKSQDTKSEAPEIQMVTEPPSKPASQQEELKVQDGSELDQKMEEEKKEEGNESDGDKKPEVAESSNSGIEEPLADRLVIASAPPFDKTMQASEFLLVYIAK